MKSEDQRIRQTASRALSSMGKMSSSALVLAKKDGDARFRVKLVKTLAAMGIASLENIIGFLRDEDESVRQEALLALVDFAREPGQAVPILTELLKHYDVNITDHTLDILSQLGADTVDILLELYFSGNLDVTHKTAEIFRVIGWSAVPRLKEMLDNPDDATSRKAAEVMVAMGVSAVPALAEALSMPSSHTRVLAALCLARLGDKARDATPELLIALEDNDNEVRFRAAFALKLIGSLDHKEAADSAIKELAEPLGDLEAMEVFVVDSRLVRARIVSDYPLIGELGLDSTGRKYLAPEEDYRGGGMGSIRVRGHPMVINPFVGKVVRVSGFYDRDLGLFAEKVEVAG
ncbi:MAG: HEAT repeat domain-containing protein [bacterium]